MSYEIIRDKILRVNNMYLLKNCILGVKSREESENGRKRYSVDVLHKYIHHNEGHITKFTSDNRIYLDSKEEQAICITIILNWLAPEPPTPSLLDI